MTNPSDSRTDGSRSRWHGRRHGKRLRKGRQSLVETLLPRLRVDVSPGDGSVDPRVLFEPGIRDIWLEVGFGGGEHLAAQAADHPEVGIVGCEAFVNGVASLLSHIENGGLRNVRIYDDDARVILERFAPESLSRVFVLFPDPWPKTRHSARRFIQTDIMDRLARLLRDGGELRVATDDMGYVRWTLDHATRHPDFEWTARRPGDWRTPPADWRPTRYEAKAIRLGRPCVYLSFVRKTRQPG